MNHVDYGDIKIFVQFPGKIRKWLLYTLANHSVNSNFSAVFYYKTFFGTQSWELDKHKKMWNFLEKFVERYPPTQTPKKMLKSGFSMFSSKEIDCSMVSVVK